MEARRFTNFLEILASLDVDERAIASPQCQCLAKYLSELKARSYDVVLTDLRMPGQLDGMGLHKRLCVEHPRLAKRVVFMTGDIMEHGIFREIEEMGLSYVKKPFDIRELARIVNGVTHGTPVTLP